MGSSSSRPCSSSNRGDLRLEQVMFHLVVGNVGDYPFYEHIGMSSHVSSTTSDTSWALDWVYVIVIVYVGNMLFNKPDINYQLWAICFHYISSPSSTTT